MRSCGTILFFLALLTNTLSVVNAHFSLFFPPPRGPVDYPKEVQFCDGYTTPGNRTQFPLSGGYITLRAGHPHWAYGILVSTSQNPTRWEDFSIVNGYSTAVEKAGNFCLPLDFSTSNVTGLSAGQGITIQVVVNSGNGNWYQCADLTLASGLNLSSTVACANATETSTSGGHGSSSTASASASGTTSGTTSPEFAIAVANVMALVALAGALLL